MSDPEQEYKQEPWWVVNARTREFIAGAKTDKDAKLAASALNGAAHCAGTPDRYRAMERPTAVE